MVIFNWIIKTIHKFLFLKDPYILIFHSYGIVPTSTSLPRQKKEGIPLKKNLQPFCVIWS
jgi:hypothetical protein